MSTTLLVSRLAKGIAQRRYRSYDRRLTTVWRYPGGSEWIVSPTLNRCTETRASSPWSPMSRSARPPTQAQETCESKLIQKRLHSKKLQDPSNYQQIMERGSHA